jgi:negative regulator of flagellin synthesis FlgM
MNIQTNFDPTQPVREPAAAARPAAASPVTQAGSASEPAVITDGDTANISAAAVAAAGFSDVRTEKVAAIQQALASGSYAVSPAQVAGKLLDHLLQG